MGEYADDLIDAGLCGWDSDAYDPFDPNIEELEQDECAWPSGSRSYEPRPVTCRYCKEKGLWWTQTAEGWRLENDEGELHKCHQGIKSEDVTF